ncbi:MAG: polysaccharide biosynthesis/export family protein [Pyrinomonadaceae bacterium]
MKVLSRFLAFELIFVFGCAVEIFAQAEKDSQGDKSINFGYSSNPPTKEKAKQNEERNTVASTKKEKKTEFDQKIKSEDTKNSADENSDKSSEEDSLANRNEDLKTNPKEKSVAAVSNMPKNERGASDDKGSGKNAEGDKNKYASQNSDVNGNAPPSTDIEKEDSGEVKEVAAKANIGEVSENKTDANSSASLAELYFIGVGDVLAVELKVAETSSRKYYTVLAGGEIDYPLAGGKIFVSGHTTNAVEEILRTKLKLFENPEVHVRVREHSSHEISVTGLVRNPGKTYLQRETIPLYVVMAETSVASEATFVTIKRAGEESKKLLLSAENTGNFMVLTGDKIHFENGRSAGNTVNSLYFIGGFVRFPGEKQFVSGITLTQAILSAGGLLRANYRKIIIRRKNKENLLESKIYDLKDIKNGKIPDPVIAVGDTIELER